MTNAVIDTLLTRVSLGALTEPAPDEATLQLALRCALRAPDHRMLRPWRFFTVRGAARERLGELFVGAMQAANPALTEVEAARARALPLRAPLLVVAAVCPQADAKVPVWEQLLSGGAAVENLLLALQAQGFASMWRTGELATSPIVKAAFGLGEADYLTGFIYIGTAANQKPIKEVVQADFCRNWEGAPA